MHETLSKTDSSASLAISFSNVRKTYRLYGSLRDQAMDVLGVRSLFSSTKVTEFNALKHINLSIAKGEQVGVVGRNGAGKTTLLKMLTGNFSPTSGTIAVNGTVQALMQTGLGFHPDFTGEENLRSALAYNGLTGIQFKEALADAIEFVELDEFLHQPFKTYSLGMRSRLQFAAATAIHPDILIVDEVLGAGDAYFSGKSAERMRRLTSGGCTLLLVSHSMQQVLQFCQRCIWLEAGEVVMDGAALPVVRAYEEYARRLEAEAAAARAQGQGSILSDDRVREKILTGIRCQELSSVAQGTELDTQNVSRWPTATDELRISMVRLRDAARTSTRIIAAGESASFELDIVAKKSGRFRARFVFVLNRADGFVAAKLVSDYLEVDLVAGIKSTVFASVPTVQLGGGRYVASAAIYREFEFDRSDAVAYDLISRCFEFEVIPMHVGDASLLYQPHTWTFREEIN